MNSKTARQYAFARLLAIEADQAFSGFAAARADDAREERLAHEYVAGVTRWRRWLDFLIDSFYKGDASKLEVKLRIILRIGTYDVMFLSTPDHASVSESVELAKSELRTGAGNLVNAILRSLLRKRDQLPQPTGVSTQQELGIRYSHPDWIVSRWVDRFGREEATELLQWNNKRPEYAIRRNSLRAGPGELDIIFEREGIEYRPGRTPGFHFVSELGPLLSGPEFRGGLMSVQDEAAGLVVNVLDPLPGDFVVDICAAPGGKATYAAELMKNEGRVVAIDRHAKRLQLVEQSSKRLGTSIVETFEADATAPLPFADADRVLVDAPCSGLGVLSKRTDLRWRMDESRLAELVELQYAILHSASRSVKPGGVLVYSTCTTEPEENQLQVARFLSENPAFKLVPASFGGDEGLVDADGYYQSIPHRHGMDGAFAAKMVRSS